MGGLVLQKVLRLDGGFERPRPLLHFMNLLKSALQQCYQVIQPVNP